jgi:hypothetical protein
MGAHNSTQSVKIVSNDRIFIRHNGLPAGIGAIVYERFYLRLGVTPAVGHNALEVTHPTMVDQYTEQPELRFGIQDLFFHWNVDDDSANLPDTSPQGEVNAFKPQINTWYCMELTIDTGTGHLAVSIDGTPQPTLLDDGTPTPNIDQAWLASTTARSRYSAVADFNLGWQDFNGQTGPMTIWFDDAALSSSPIGCY